MTTPQYTTTEAPHPTTDLRETRERSDLAAEMTGCSVSELCAIVRNGHPADVREAAADELRRRRDSRPYDFGRLYEAAHEVVLSNELAPHETGRVIDRLRVVLAEVA